MSICTINFSVEDTNLENNWLVNKVATYIRENKDKSFNDLATYIARETTQSNDTDNLQHLLNLANRTRMLPMIVRYLDEQSGNAGNIHDFYTKNQADLVRYENEFQLKSIGFYNAVNYTKDIFNDLSSAETDADKKKEYDNIEKLLAEGYDDPWLFLYSRYCAINDKREIKIIDEINSNYTPGDMVAFESTSGELQFGELVDKDTNLGTVVVQKADGSKEVVPFGSNSRLKISIGPLAFSYIQLGKTLGSVKSKLDDLNAKTTLTADETAQKNALTNELNDLTARKNTLDSDTRMANKLTELKAYSDSLHVDMNSLSKKQLEQFELYYAQKINPVISEQLKKLSEEFDKAVHEAEKAIVSRNVEFISNPLGIFDITQEIEDHKITDSDNIKLGCNIKRIMQTDDTGNLYLTKIDSASGSPVKVTPYLKLVCLNVHEDPSKSFFEQQKAVNASQKYIMDQVSADSVFHKRVFYGSKNYNGYVLVMCDEKGNDLRFDKNGELVEAGGELGLFQFKSSSYYLKTKKDGTENKFYKTSHERIVYLLTHDKQFREDRIAQEGISDIDALADKLLENTKNVISKIEEDAFKNVHYNEVSKTLNIHSPIFSISRKTEGGIVLQGYSGIECANIGLFDKGTKFRQRSNDTDPHGPGILIDSPINNGRRSIGLKMPSLSSVKLTGGQSLVDNLSDYLAGSDSIENKKNVAKEFMIINKFDKRKLVNIPSKIKDKDSYISLQTVKKIPSIDSSVEGDIITLRKIGIRAGKYTGIYESYLFNGTTAQKVVFKALRDADGKVSLTYYENDTDSPITKEELSKKIKSCLTQTNPSDSSEQLVNLTLDRNKICGATFDTEKIKIPVKNSSGDIELIDTNLKDFVYDDNTNIKVNIKIDNVRNGKIVPLNPAFELNISGYSHVDNAFAKTGYTPSNQDEETINKTGYEAEGFTVHDVTFGETDLDVLSRKSYDVYEKENERAKEWFNKSKISKFVNLTYLQDIAHTEAVASYSKKGIILYKGSNDVDLYHESWHAFTQGFMKPEERKKLYDEIRGYKGSFKNQLGETINFKDATNLQIEEYLADEFERYMIYKERPKIESKQKMSFFKRLLNFLKELFGKIVKKSTKENIDKEELKLASDTIRNLFNKLSTNNIDEYTFNIENSEFLVNNKQIESINKENIKRLPVVRGKVIVLSKKYAEQVNGREGWHCLDNDEEYNNIIKYYNNAISNETDKKKKTELAEKRVIDVAVFLEKHKNEIIYMSNQYSHSPALNQHIVGMLFSDRFETDDDIDSIQYFNNQVVRNLKSKIISNDSLDNLITLEEIEEVSDTKPENEQIHRSEETISNEVSITLMGMTDSLMSDYVNGINAGYINKDDILAYNDIKRFKETHYALFNLMGYKTIKDAYNSLQGEEGKAILKLFGIEKNIQSYESIDITEERAKEVLHLNFKDFDINDLKFSYDVFNNKILVNRLLEEEEKLKDAYVKKSSTNASKLIMGQDPLELRNAYSYIKTNMFNLLAEKKAELKLMEDSNENKIKVANLIDILEYGLANFGDASDVFSNLKSTKGLISNHLISSPLFEQVRWDKNLQEAENEKGDEDTGEQLREDMGVDVLDNLSEEVEFLLKTLPYYKYEDGKFSPDRDKISGLNKFCNVRSIMNRIIHAVSEEVGDEYKGKMNDFDIFVYQLKKLGETYPPIAILYDRLGNPESENIDEMTLWTKFYQAFNTYKINFTTNTYIRSVKEEDGKVEYKNTICHTGIGFDYTSKTIKDWFTDPNIDFKDSVLEKVNDINGTTIYINKTKLKKLLELIDSDGKQIKEARILGSAMSINTLINYVKDFSIHYKSNEIEINSFSDFIQNITLEDLLTNYNPDKNSWVNPVIVSSIYRGTETDDKNDIYIKLPFENSKGEDYKKDFYIRIKDVFEKNSNKIKQDLNKTLEELNISDTSNTSVYIKTDDDKFYGYSDFTKNAPLAIKALRAIGINLSPNTKLEKDVEKNWYKYQWPARNILALALKGKEKEKKDISKFIEGGERRSIKVFAELENKYGDKRNNFQIRTADGNTAYQNILPNYYVSIIRDLNHCSNYQQVLDTPHLKKYDIRRTIKEYGVDIPNPNYNSIVDSTGIIQALFEVKEGFPPRIWKRRETSYGERYSLSLSILNGSVVKDREDSDESTGSPRYESDEFVHLSSSIEYAFAGYFEQDRNADKRTTYSIYLPGDQNLAFKPQEMCSYLSKEKDDDIVLNKENFKDLVKTKVVEPHIIKSIIAEAIRVYRCRTILNTCFDKSGNLKDDLSEEQKQQDWNYIKRGAEFLSFGSKKSKDGLTTLSKETIEKLDNIVNKVLNTTDGNPYDNIENKIKSDSDLFNSIVDDVTSFCKVLVEDETKKFEEGGFIAHQRLAKMQSTFAKEKEEVEKEENPEEKKSKEESELEIEEDNDTLKQKALIFHSLNSWVHSVKSWDFLYGDIALYDQADTNKRIAGASSNGKHLRHDGHMSNYLNKQLSDNSYASKHGGNNFIYGSTMKTGVMKELVTSSAYISELKEIGINTHEYEKMKENDAQGFVTIDAYRAMKIAEGEWTTQQEKLYNKIINDEPVSVEDCNTFFPVYKMQYYGNLDKDGMQLMAMHKYSLMPIIPCKAIKNTKLEKLNQMMIKQGLAYVTFTSGSKVSTVTTYRKGIDLKNIGDELFDEDGNINLDKSNLDKSFTPNVIFTECLKDQVKIHEHDMNKILFPTQERRLIELGLMELYLAKENIDGRDVYTTKSRFVGLSKEQKDSLIKKLTDEHKSKAEIEKEVKIADENERKRIEAAVKKYEEDINLSRDIARQDLEKEIDLKYVLDEAGNFVYDEYGRKKCTADLTKLKHLILSNLTREDITTANIRQILSIERDAIKDLSVSIYSQKVEDLLIALVNRRLIKQYIHGEGFVQVASGLLEKVKEDGKVEKQFINPTKEQIEEYGTRGLPFYFKKSEKDGSYVRAMKVKVSMRPEFKKLLYLKDGDDSNSIFENANKALEKDGDDSNSIFENAKKALEKDGSIASVAQIEEKATERLNQLLKDEEWLNKDNHRKMITLTGVRIPTQGHNSMEFMEVYEFLPPSFGNVIIPPVEIVAKTGSDFDIDKMYIMTPKYYENTDGTIEYLTRGDMSLDKLNEKIDSLKNQIEEEKDKLKNESQFIFSRKKDLFDSLKSLKSKLKDAVGTIDVEKEFSERKKEELKKLLGTSKDISDFIDHMKTSKGEISDEEKNILKKKFANEKVANICSNLTKENIDKIFKYKDISSIKEDIDKLSTSLFLKRLGFDIEESVDDLTSQINDLKLEVKNNNLEEYEFIRAVLKQIQDGGSFDRYILGDITEPIRNISSISELIQSVKDNDLKRAEEISENISDKTIKNDIDNAVSFINKIVDALKTHIDNRNKYQSSIDELKRLENIRKDGVNNDLISDIANILSLDRNYKNLVTPNTTDIFKEKPNDKELSLTSEMEPINGGTLKSLNKDYSCVRTPMWNEIKNMAFSVGKRMLGILAVENVSNALLARCGAYMNKVFNKSNHYSSPIPLKMYIDKCLTSGGINRKKLSTYGINVLMLDHKTKIIDEDGKEQIILDDFGEEAICLTTDLTTDGLSVPECISQLINGAVDVAKDEWLFLLGADEHTISVFTYMLMAGVSPKDAVHLISTKGVKDYDKYYKKSDSAFNKELLKDPRGSEMYPGTFAAIKVYEDFFYSIRESIKEKNKDIPDKKSRIEKCQYELNDKLNQIENIVHAKLGDDIREKIHKKTGFNQSDVECLKMFFCGRDIQEEKNLNSKEIKDLAINGITKEEDSILNMKAFSAFLFANDSSKDLTNLKLNTKVDTTKDQDYSEALKRLDDLEDLGNSQTFGKNLLKNIKENSPISKFFIGDVMKGVVESLFNQRNSGDLIRKIASVSKTTLKKIYGGSTDYFKKRYIQNAKSQYMQYLYMNSILYLNDDGSPVNTGKYLADAKTLADTTITTEIGGHQLDLVSKKYFRDSNGKEIPLLRAKYLQEYDKAQKELESDFDAITGNVSDENKGDKYESEKLESLFWSIAKSYAEEVEKTALDGFKTFENDSAEKLELRKQCYCVVKAMYMSKNPVFLLCNSTAGYQMFYNQIKVRNLLDNSSFTRAIITDTSKDKKFRNLTIAYNGEYIGNEEMASNLKLFQGDGKSSSETVKETIRKRHTWQNQILLGDIKKDSATEKALNKQEESVVQFFNLFDYFAVIQNGYCPSKRPLRLTDIVNPNSISDVIATANSALIANGVEQSILVPEYINKFEKGEKSTNQKNRGKNFLSNKDIFLNSSIMSTSIDVKGKPYILGSISESTDDMVSFSLSGVKYNGNEIGNINYFYGKSDDEEHKGNVYVSFADQDKCKKLVTEAYTYRFESQGGLYDKQKEKLYGTALRAMNAEQVVVFQKIEEAGKYTSTSVDYDKSKRSIARATVMGNAGELVSMAIVNNINKLKNGDTQIAPIFIYDKDRIGDNGSNWYRVEIYKDNATGKYEHKFVNCFATEALIDFSKPVAISGSKTPDSKEVAAITDHIINSLKSNPNIEFNESKVKLNIAEYVDNVIEPIKLSRHNSSFDAEIKDIKEDKKTNLKHLKSWMTKEDALREDNKDVLFLYKESLKSGVSADYEKNEKYDLSEGVENAAPLTIYKGKNNEFDLFLKKQPGYADKFRFVNDDFDEFKKAIDEDINNIISKWNKGTYKKIVVPQDIYGNSKLYGISRTNPNASLISSYYNKKMKFLSDYVNAKSDKEKELLVKEDKESDFISPSTVEKFIELLSSDESVITTSTNEDKIKAIQVDGANVNFKDFVGKRLKIKENKSTKKSVELPFYLVEESGNYSIKALGSSKVIQNLGTIGKTEDSKKVILNAIKEALTDWIELPENVLKEQLKKNPDAVNTKDPKLLSISLNHMLNNPLYKQNNTVVKGSINKLISELNDEFLEADLRAEEADLLRYEARTTEVKTPDGKIIKLNTEQQRCVERVGEFIKNRVEGVDGTKSGFHIFGPAGTGKTTILQKIVENFSSTYGGSANIVEVAASHKAKNIAGLLSGQDKKTFRTATIASFFGAKAEDNFKIPISKKSNRYIFGDKSIANNLSSGTYTTPTLLIVDESSMVDANSFNAFLQLVQDTWKKSADEKPKAPVVLLFVGDNDQVLSVGTTGDTDSIAFTSPYIDNENGHLTKVMRQSSDNPLLSKSLELRAFIDKCREKKKQSKELKKKYNSDSDYKDYKKILFPDTITKKEIENKNRTSGIIHISSLETPSELLGDIEKIDYKDSINRNKKTVKSLMPLVKKSIELKDFNYFKIVCYRNDNVNAYNRLVAEELHPGKIFDIGDPVISNTNVYNGITKIENAEEGIITGIGESFSEKIESIEVSGQILTIDIQTNSGIKTVNVKNLDLESINKISKGFKSGIFSRDQMSQIYQNYGQFTLGFAITAHKAQGSTYDNVVVDVEDINKNGVDGEMHLFDDVDTVVTFFKENDIPLNITDTELRKLPGFEANKEEYLKYFNRLSEFMSDAATLKGEKDLNRTTMEKAKMLYTALTRAKNYAIILHSNTEDTIGKETIYLNQLSERLVNLKDKVLSLTPDDIKSGKSVSWIASSSNYEVVDNSEATSLAASCGL